MKNIIHKPDKQIEVKQIDWFDQHFYRLNLDGNDIYFPSVTTKLDAEAKPFLARWRGDIGNREADIIMRTKADRGSRIHFGWYLMTTGGTVIYNPFQRPNYTGEEIEKIAKESNGILILENQDEMYDLYKLQEWHKIVNPKVEANELIVYSLKNEEAGQLDKLMYIKEGEYMINGAKPLFIEEGLYVVDLKTGNTFPDNGFMQISAYKNCYEEMNKKGITDKIITGIKSLFNKQISTEVKGGIIIHTGAKTKKGIEGLATYLRTSEELKEDYLDYRAVATVWERRKKNMKPRIFSFPTLIKMNE